MNHWRIGEVLIQKKLIDWQQLEDALTEQQRTREFIGEVLVRKQYIPRFLLFRALAEQHAIPFVDLPGVFIDPLAVQRVPRSIALKYNIIPIEIQGEMLIVGVNDPLTVFPEKEVAEIAKVSQIKKVLCMPDAISKALNEHYGSPSEERK